MLQQLLLMSTCHGNQVCLPTSSKKTTSFLTCCLFAAAICYQIRRQSPVTVFATICRRIRRQSPNSATIVSIVDRALQRRSVGYRRPGRTAILPPPKVVRCLIPPYHHHFCRPLLIATEGGAPLPTPSHSRYATAC